MNGPLTCGITLDKHASDGHFGLGFFCQTNTHSVAQSVFEQGSDAQGRFDAAILSVPGLRHPKVKRKCHVFLVHARDQEAVRLDHDLRVGRLHGHHHIEIPFVHTNAQELEGAFHHAQRRIAIATHDAVRQGTVVGANPHGPAKLLAFLDEWGEFSRMRTSSSAYDSSVYSKFSNRFLSA